MHRPSSLVTGHSVPPTVCTSRAATSIACIAQMSVCPSVDSVTTKNPAKTDERIELRLAEANSRWPKESRCQVGDVHWRHLTNTNGVVGGCDAASQYYYSSNLSDLATLTEGNENPMGVSPLMLHEMNDRAADCVQWLSVNQSLKYCKCET